MFSKLLILFEGGVTRDERLNKRYKYQNTLANRNPETVEAVSSCKTEGRRDDVQDVQVSREGRIPVATAALEPTWMYLRRVLSDDTASTVLHQFRIKSDTRKNVLVFGTLI